jgi:hypothetical protein
VSNSKIVAINVMSGCLLLRLLVLCLLLQHNMLELGDFPAE